MSAPAFAALAASMAAKATLDDPIHGDGMTDVQTQNLPTAWPVNTIAYGPANTVKMMAYGGNKPATPAPAIINRIYRLERGYPKIRRGSLIPAIPRTKAETLYTKDTGQALQNKVLNTGASGTGTSGVPLPGTTNKPNATTGALNRYRTPYKTLLQ